MTKKVYVITNSAGANVRQYPSGTYPSEDPVKTLAKGEKVTVIMDWKCTSTTEKSSKDSTKYRVYRPVLIDKKIYYIVDYLMEEYKEPEPTHLQKAAAAVPVVYKAAVGCKHDGSGIKSLADIKAKKAVSCAATASAVLQAAGCLDVGIKVNHTTGVGSNILSKKKTKDQCMKNWKYLKNCTITYIGKKFADMDAKYKKPGTVYVQDSNMCTNLDGKIICSCNNSSDQMSGGRYKSYDVIKRKSGYCFTSPILFAIVPDNK